MVKTLYHIKCSQIQAITHMRDILDAKGIENYIGNGGIHIHLLDKQLEDAKEIAQTLSKEVKKGMLPNTQEDINTLFREVSKCHSSQ